jgi:hypothetical protein
LKNLVYISSLFLVLFAFNSCKKKSREETIVNFHLHNPVTGEVLSGVKVKVFREKYKSSTIFNGNVLGPLKSDVEVVDSAFTDDQGKATIKFKAYGNTKYAYFPYVPSSAFDGLYLYKRTDYSSSIEKDQENNYEFLYTVQDAYYRHIKNVYNSNENDQLKIREKWQYGIKYSGWSEWTIINGAYDVMMYYDNVYTDCKIYEYEVTRNGATSYFMDTICLNPYSIDTLKIFY